MRIKRERENICSNYYNSFIKYLKIKMTGSTCVYIFQVVIIYLTLTVH